MVFSNSVFFITKLCFICFAIYQTDLARLHFLIAFRYLTVLDLSINENECYALEMSKPAQIALKVPSNTYSID